jgi:CcmD family protein
MPIGLKHFFYAYSLVWILLIGYLLNLAFRQKHLADELRALKDRLSRKAAD